MSVSLNRLSLVCAFLVGAILFSAASAFGGSIGISFMSDRDNPDAQLAPNEVAGVVAQPNWNTNDGGVDPVAAANGSNSQIVSPSAGALVDDSGAITGVNVNWASNGTWNTVNGTATPDAKLMNGYIDNIGADGALNVEISNIPYSLYDVIVYIASDGNGRTGEVTDGTTTFSYSTFSNDPDGSGGFDPADYLQTTDTAAGFPEANYAVFSGLTGSSVNIDVIRGSSNSGLHGIQIVEVPEPSTIALLALALGVIGLAASRRRNK